MINNLRLLIVDDHEMILDSLYLLFNMMESVVQVHKESDSRNVMDFLKENEIDVLVTDYKMPHLDGLQLIHMVRNVYPDIKILVLSPLQKVIISGNGPFGDISIILNSLMLRHHRGSKNKNIIQNL
ncbi:MAG: DNA-binding NtrC family response regulator, partial [Saprospiraceae bacterium]